MWKILILATVLIHLGEAQRSSYAARPGSRSKLLPRYKNNQTDSNLVTRGGEENESSTTLRPELQGTLEDHDLVHRVSQWPEDRQPFWFKNRKAISSMRGQDIDGGNVIPSSFDGNQRPRPQFQSPFQGPGRGRGVGLGNKSNMGRGRGRNEAKFASEEYYRDFDNDPLLMYLHRLHNY